MLDCNPSKIPAAFNVLLVKNIQWEKRKDNWGYQLVINLLNYLVDLTHPELVYLMRQGTRFCGDTKISHEVAMKKIFRYWKGT